MPHYYIGRQPIFDNSLEVFGYELLYRAHDTEGVVNVDGDQATSQVLLNSFMEMGLNELVGDHKAFVNLTRHFVVNHELIPSASEQLVLEILEDIDGDAEVVEAVAKLKEKGYAIALDDFIFRESLRPLIELADIIKIDILALNREELQSYVTELRRYPLQLLAEKVETHDDFDFCKGLGFDLYQGFFLCKPKTLKGRRAPSNRVTTMQMLAKLQDPELEIPELEKVISLDITLSYKLLRYINSAAFSLRNKIESIHHAIVYLGLHEVKNWASLIALANINDKPSELFVTTLTRARMCELMSEHTGVGNKGSAFIVGLFSTLEAIMDAPMEELLKDVPVVPEVSDALLKKRGTYADMLRTTIAYERGEWDQVRCHRLEQGTIADIYMRAVKWSTQASVSLRSDSELAA